MFTSFKRVIKFGWQSFSRNKGLSFQVIFIVVISVLTITSLFLFREMSNFLIAQAQKKVDISVYFSRDASQEQILEVKKELDQLSDKVEKVEYISRDEALRRFTKTHQSEPYYLEALDQIGENPLLASLNIKAKNPVFYAKISNFLKEGKFSNLIKKVSYYQNQKVIDRLILLTKNVKTWGILLSLVLGILVVLITFNTVKLTIFELREEISTMRLVGASNWLIRGPFAVQGFLYGILAVGISDLLISVGLKFLSPTLERQILGFSVLNYFQQNFLFLISIQIIFAVTLAVGSSLIAVRKYLKI